MFWDRLIIKGNEIKEPGLFGKTIYVIKGNEIREPGMFGKTVYVIKGNEIKEPGIIGRTVYVIKGDEIRKPGIVGERVAKIDRDGDINYNKPQVTETPKTVPKVSTSTVPSSTSCTAQTYQPTESIEELRERLEKEIGCVVDYTNCNPERTSYTVPKKYNKLQLIAPALRLETIKIHDGVAVIVGKDIRVKKAFIVDEANPYYSTEDGVLYNKAKTVLVRVPLEHDMASFTMPNTVTIIGDGAFSGCTMGAYTVPSTVTKIGKLAFAWCKQFKSIFIPQTVTEIGEKAFDLDNSLQIMTNASSKPTGWKFDESQQTKPIKWGVV